MEEVYGLYGVEGNGTFKVFDEEVDMTLPFAESDTFSVNSTPIFPAELKDNPDAFFVRGDDYTEQILTSPEGGQFYEFAEVPVGCTLPSNQIRTMLEKTNG